MDLCLEDKIVLVSGSSRGIGRATALAYQKEGARVVVTGRARKDVDAVVDGGTSARGFVGDLEKSDTIQKCVQQTLKAWGRIDVLVCNIGSGSGQPGWDSDDDAWERFLRTNLLSAVRLARAVIPAMGRTGGGSIVFVSSIAGLEHVGAPLPYQAAKAALLAHVKGLSRTVAGLGIRVNAVAPGNVFFPGGTWDKKLRADRRKVSAMLKADVPLKRFGTPEEIADAILFLSSSRASFVTGACLTVDGGQTRGFLS